MSPVSYPVGLQQRILPVYRAPFFEALGSACDGKLSVFAGLPRPQEAIESRLSLNGVVLRQAQNIHIFNGMGYLCWQRGLIRWLEAWKPEVLIVEANPRCIHTPMAVQWMKKRNLPVIGWGLGAPEPTGRLASLRINLRRRFYNRFDAMIAYSSQGAEQYNRMGVPANRVFTAYNAAVLRPKIPPAQRPPEYLNQKPVILFVGRLVERKRIDSLIRCCSQLEGLEPYLWIVGDGPHRQALEELARQVYPAARFFGAMFGKDLDAVFDRSDVFVLPGTGGLAVQQAMSHGLPVVVAEADGTQDDLVRPENGWVVAPGDEMKLVQTLKEALADPIRLRQMGKASYRLVDEEVNLENMVDVFLQAIQSVSKDKR